VQKLSRHPANKLLEGPSFSFKPIDTGGHIRLSQGNSHNQALGVGNGKDAAHNPFLFF